MSRHSRPTLKVMESSLFLMASTGLTAGFGYFFWILVGHNYSTQRVGLATSLINTIQLISYLSLFGFNSVLIRHQARGPARDRQVTVSLLITGTGGLAFGGAFLALLPWISPKLMFIREDFWYALLFVGFCAFAAVNLLTDSVFMAARLPQYNMLVDGFLQSLSKLAMPVLLVTFGAVGIVASNGIGFTVAVVASLIAMWLRLGYRPDFRFGGTRLREQARYSLASYGSSLLNLLPQLALPLIALQKLGSEAEAYYFMAYQVANMMYAASHAIGDATFSEASNNLSKLGECLKRSAKLNLVLLVPGTGVVCLAAGLLLGLFGQTYAQHARGLLILLVVGSLAVALNNWTSNALRVIGRMRPFVWSNVLFAAVSIGTAFVMAPRGLLWVGGAWVAGNFVSGVVCLPFIPRNAVELAAEPGAEEAAAALRDTGTFAVIRDTGTFGAIRDTGTFAAIQDTGTFAILDATVPLMLPWLADTGRKSGARTARERAEAADARGKPVQELWRDGVMAVREFEQAGKDRAGRSW